MKNEKNLEKSPFYVEYTGELKAQSFKAPASLEKTLRKHFEHKYADEIKKDGKLKYGKYIRKTLEEYLNNKSLEYKTFDNSIYLITNADGVKQDYFLNPVFVRVPSLYYATSYHSNQYYQVHIVNSTDYKGVISHLDEKDIEWFEKLLKENDLIFEIPLNNYLDVFQNGEYYKKTNKYSNNHAGANILTMNDKSYGIIYSWNVKPDFSINVYSIRIVHPQNLLLMLNNNKNDEIYADYALIFKNIDSGYLDIEKTILETKLNMEKKKINECKKNIKKLENQLNSL